MAELQLLPALLAMYKSIGDILEAGQQEGGTIDVFEIQLAHEVVKHRGRQGHPAAAPDRGDHSAPETGMRLGDPRATRGIPRVSSFWL